MTSLELACAAQLWRPAVEPQSTYSRGLTIVSWFQVLDSAWQRIPQICLMMVLITSTLRRTHGSQRAFSRQAAVQRCPRCGGLYHLRPHSAHTPSPSAPWSNPLLTRETKCSCSGDPMYIHVYVLCTYIYINTYVF